MTAATDDGTALLKAIIAHPEEDTHRLVFADWLQENGEEARAEFIRVQCEWAKLCTGITDPCDDLGFGWSLLEPAKSRAGELLARINSLLSAPSTEHPDRTNGWSWFGRHVEWAEGHSTCRGFVERLTCGVSVWFHHGDEIRERHPVSAVRLTTVMSMDTFSRLPSADPSQLGLYSIADQLVPLYGWDFEVADPPDTYWKVNCLLNRVLLQRRWPGVAFTLPT